MINEDSDGVRKGVLVRTYDAGTPGDGEVDGYQEWILEVVKELVDPSAPTLPPFDGVMFDVSYSAGRLAPRTRNALNCMESPEDDPICPAASTPPDPSNPSGCPDLGQPCEADFLVEGLSTLLQRVKNAPFMQDKLVMYNGLQFFNSNQRACCRHVEPLLTDLGTAAVDGVHNEYFCWHRDEAAYQSRDNLLHDLSLQWAIGKGQLAADQAPQWVVSKVNYRDEYQQPAGVPSEVEAGEGVQVFGSDATFLKKATITENNALCDEGESHNRYAAGAAGLDWSRRLRVAGDSACCDTRTACAQGDRCVPTGSVSAPLAGLDAVCVDRDLDGESYGPALYACDQSILEDPPLVEDSQSGRSWCCGRTVPQTHGTLAAVFRFEPEGHSSCSAPLSCQDSKLNHARRMGEDFGRVWGPALRHGTFSKCCDPQLTCNRDACFAPGTVLPRLRDTDEVCGGIEPVGTSLGFKPALYTCDAGNVGETFEDEISGSSWCCTERLVDGNPVYVFDDPSHESCVQPPVDSCENPQLTNRKSFWGPNVGTDWSLRDPTPTLSYNAPGCCNPALQCNRGGNCYSPGTLLPRLGATQEICAQVAENANGQLRPAIYRCAEETVGQTMTTPNAFGGSVSYCCTREADSETDTTTQFAFQPGACQG